jgi:hypothetical protein
MYKSGQPDPLWQWRFVRQENDEKGSLDLSIYRRLPDENFLEVFSDLKTGAGSKTLLAVVTAFVGSLLAIEAQGCRSVRGVLVATSNIEVLTISAIRAELALAEYKLASQENPESNLW